MSAVKPFGTLRDWMVGRQPVTPENSQNYQVASINMTTSPQRHRILGLRQDADDSCDLPSSEDVLLHLASSKSGGGIRHVVDDGRGYTSYATSLGSQDGPDLRLDSHEQMQAQVDALRKEMQELKRDRDHGGQAALTSHARSENDPPGYSTAAGVAGDVVAVTGQSQPATFAVSRARIDALLATASTPQHLVRQSFNSAHDNEDSVIVSSASDAARNLSKPIAKGQPTSIIAKGAKSPPHFAQPTASFSRRSGENPSHATKVSISPPKSLQSSGGTAVTNKSADKRKKHKRNNLPGHWKSTGEIHKNNPSTQRSTDRLSAPGNKSLGVGNKTPQSPQGIGYQQLCKQTSSYMSSTKAATQRAITTLAEAAAHRTMSKANLGHFKADMGEARGSVVPTGTPKMARHAAPAQSQTEMLQDFSRKAQISPSPRISKDAVATGSKLHAEGRRAIAMAYSSPTKVLIGIPSKTKAGAASGSIMPKPVPNEIWSSLSPTVTQRRTSCADILESIYSSLEKVGLHKDNPDVSLLSDDARRSREDIAQEEEVRKISMALQNVALLARQGVAGRPVMMPPHLNYGPRQLSAMSAMSEASAATTSTGASLMRKDVVQHSSIVNSRKSSLAADGAGKQAVNTERKVSAAKSSLRATAKSFTPMWTPQSTAQQLGLISWQGTLNEYSSEEWAELPNDVRNSIVRLKNFKREGTASGLQSPTHGASPSKRAEQRFWGRVMGTDNSVMPAPGQGAPPPPHAVQAGQKLVPELSPGKEHVRWTLEDLDGQKKPVTFGRTPLQPAPSATTQAPTLHTPISTAEANPSVYAARGASEDPFATVSYSSRPWTMSPSYGASRRPFGWKGGDGKEITFSGYGPMAESNLSGPFNMFFQPGYMGQKQTNSYECPQPKVWPRSQKQWEEYAALGKVPCSTVQVPNAIDWYPSDPFSGTCNDCARSGIVPASAYR